MSPSSARPRSSGAIRIPDAEGNLRDHAPLEQPVVLTNLESLNSVLIRQDLPAPERLLKLNEIAITQMRTSSLPAVGSASTSPIESALAHFQTLPLEDAVRQFHHAFQEIENKPFIIHPSSFILCPMLGSTLSNDPLSDKRFDFPFVNPP
jgi:hypothetical protein